MVTDRYLKELHMTENQDKKEVSEEEIKEEEKKRSDGVAMGCLTVSLLLFIFGMVMLSSFIEWLFTSSFSSH
jgi:uncharacterized protein YqhQ